jgi:hypothetical protein
MRNFFVLNVNCPELVQNVACYEKIDAFHNRKWREIIYVMVETGRSRIAVSVLNFW